ncbi:MAG: dihydroneopterin aldolase [Dehalococcoidia bacterium]
MSDTIFIRQARFDCHLGVTPKERSEPQEVFVDISLEMDTSVAGKSDRIGDTINYTDVWQRVRDCIEPTEFRLVEALAESIAQVVLSGFPRLDGVCVRVTKPRALASKNAEGAGVEICRRRF